MKVNTSIALKAGLFGAVAGLVIAVLGRVPFLGCIIAPLGWVVAVGTGVLYTHFALAEGPVELMEGGAGGALAGAIAGFVQSLVSGVLALIFGAVGAASELMGSGDAGAAAIVAGATLIGVIGGIVAGAIIGAILGGIGGAVYAAIKGKS